jgi:predicted DNA-binding transcriptional regulator YafY
MSRGMNRAERIREMERLYLQRAYSDMEMAERLGVNRSTVFRDRIALETEIQFVPDDQGRWRIDRAHYISSIRVNLHEALVLYLAARRAARQTRIAQPHAAGALEKLAATLRQPMTERLVRAAGSLLEQPPNPERVQVMETIALGWAEQRKLRILHRSLSARHSNTFTICPYLIEPSLWSDGAYLIGASEGWKELATFKIERIEQAELTRETFELPQDFDEQELLRYAWGIWYAQGEPVTVKLRFAAGEAARRLQESTWHPTQQVEILADGGCLWTAQVAEWQEMLPWVRGWGADCEVLEPRELREVMMGITRAMAEQYGWEVSPKATDANDLH